MLLLLLWLVFFWLLAVASLILFNFGLARFFERLVPPQGRFIEVDGVRLHVVDSGEKPGQIGPPLLFLHGLLGQLNHFSFALAALFPERRVVLLDRPGSGFSQAAPSQSLAAQADLAAKVIALLNLDKPLVVGHSFGGAVGLALALDHPECVGGLALVAPLTHPFAPSQVIAGLGVGNRFARWLGAWTLGPIVALTRIGLTQRMVFAPDLLIAGVLDARRRFSGHAAVADARRRAGVARGSKGTDRHGGALRRADGSGRGVVWRRRRRAGPQGAGSSFLRQGAAGRTDNGPRRPYAAHDPTEDDRILYSQHSGAARRRLSPQEQIMVLRKILVSAALSRRLGGQRRRFRAEKPRRGQRRRPSRKNSSITDLAAPAAIFRPRLSWSDPPAGTKSFAVLVHDPDAPTGGAGFWHWVVYNIPATATGLPQGVGKEGKGLPEGAAQMATDFGVPGYGGPCPPKGDAPHHYHFTVYALKTDKLELPPHATASLAGFLINANALGKATLTGTSGASANAVHRRGPCAPSEQGQQASNGRLVSTGWLSLREGLLDKRYEANRFSARAARYLAVGAQAGGFAARLAGGRLLGDGGDGDALALARTLGGLKGPLMKAAQFIATIPEALPADFAEALLTLQSEAPPMGAAFVKRRMVAELGPGWREKFAAFDLHPAAAASLGQVHRATTLTGADVACKLQYPDMASAVEADLSQLDLALSLYRRLDTAIDAREAAQEVAERLREELDYHREARNALLYKLMLADGPRCACPPSTKIFPPGGS